MGQALRSKRCGHDICRCPEKLEGSWPEPVKLIDAEGTVIEKAGHLRDAIAAGEPTEDAVAAVVAAIDTLDGLFAEVQ